MGDHTSSERLLLPVGSSSPDGELLDSRPVEHTLESALRLPSLLHPVGASGTPARPALDPQAALDLGLAQIFEWVTANAENKRLLEETLRQPLPEVSSIRFRQEIFADLEKKAVKTAAVQFVEQIHQVHRRLEAIGKLHYQLERQGWLLETAAAYCDAVQALAVGLNGSEIRSEGLRGVGDALRRLVGSEAFEVLQSDLSACRSALGSVRFCVRIQGATVEVSRYEDQPDYSKEIAETFERFQQGAVKDYRIKFRFPPGMNHITARIAELVSKLYPDEFAALAGFCSRHAGFYDEQMGILAGELEFYLAYLAFIEPIRATGHHFAYPEVSETSKDVSACSTFDLALAGHLARAGRPVVTNDFHLAPGERVIVVTGPNQGGKTTFARTFGQLHHLAAIGCPVPGEHVCTFHFDRIFSLFAGEEDLSKVGGKLEDDVMRTRDILTQATDRSIVVLNEVFASTTLRDAVFLGRKVLDKVTALDLLCVYVTFVDELAFYGPSVVSMMSTVDPEDPARRTYKVVRQPANGVAHALAIAEKCRVTYEQLKARWQL